MTIISHSSKPNRRVDDNWQKQIQITLVLEQKNTQIGTE
jgi:hypothetical protein